MVENSLCHKCNVEEILNDESSKGRQENTLIIFTNLFLYIIGKTGSPAFIMIV